MVPAINSSAKHSHISTRIFRLTLFGVLTLTSCGARGNSEDATGSEGIPSASNPAGPTDIARDFDSGNAPMPDVIGESITDAYSALAAAGITDIATPDERPQLGTPGVVIDQVPEPGAAVPGTVSLVVSIPLPDMPDYSGRPFDEVAAELDSWGIDVQIQEEITGERPDQEVIETTPKPGSRIGSQVDVVVAVAPKTTKLTEDSAPLVDAGAKPEENGFDPDVSVETRSVDIGGDSYKDALVTRQDDNDIPIDVVHWDYNTSKDWTQFRAIAGLDDTSDAGESALYQVIADGRVIWEQDIAFGQAIPVDLDITGVLRLTLRIETRTAGRAAFAWAEPVIVGKAE